MSERVVYGIACIERVTYGHGDSGAELKIRRMGAYGEGAFPPIFELRKDAEAWIERHPRHCGTVVELTLVQGGL